MFVVSSYFLAPLMVLLKLDFGDWLGNQKLKTTVKSRSGEEPNSRHPDPEYI